MQKKLLASLLVVPMVYSAFADISVDLKTENWASDGSVGGNFTVGNDGADVNTTVGVSSVSKTVNFYTGNYKLTFTSATNIVVKVNAYMSGAPTPIEVTEDKDNANTYTFSIGPDFANTNGQVKFELIVAAKNVSDGFSFKGLSLGIDCDFAAIGNTFKKRLQGANLAKDALSEIPEDFPASEEVIAKLKADTTGLYADSLALQARYDEISDTINALPAYADSSVTAKIKEYEKYQLYKFVDTDSVASSSVIDVDLKALIADVEAYNNRVNHFNGYIENLPKNIANYTADTTLLKKFQDSLNLLAATKIEGSQEQTDYIQAALTDSCKLAQNSIDAFADTLKKVYANYLDADTLIKFDNKPDSTNIANRLAAVNNAIKDAKENLAAYDSILALNDTVFTDFSAALNALNALKADPTYVEETGKNPVTDLTSKVKTLLNKKYAEYIAAAGEGIDNAKANLAKAKAARAEFNKFINVMDTIPFANKKGITGIQDTVKFENDTLKAFYATYGTDSTGLVGKYKVYKQYVESTTTIDTTTRKEYLKKLEGIDTLIAGLKDSVYHAYENLTTFALYNDSLKSINDQFAAFSSFGKILDLNLALAAQRDSLKIGKYAISFTDYENVNYKTNLAETFRQTLDNLQNAINNLDPKDADGTLDKQIEAIENSIGKVVLNADTVRGYFDGLDSIFKKYSDTVTSVNKFIKAAEDKVINTTYVPTGYEYYKVDTIKTEAVYKTDFYAPFDALDKGIPAAMNATGNVSFLQFKALYEKVYGEDAKNPTLQPAYNYIATALGVEKALYDAIAAADVKTTEAVKDSIGKMLDGDFINQADIAAELTKYDDSIATTKTHVEALAAADAEDFKTVDYTNTIDTLSKHYINGMIGLLSTVDTYKAAKALYDSIAADTIKVNDLLASCKTAAGKDTIWDKAIAADSASNSLLHSNLETAYGNTLFKTGQFGAETLPTASLTNKATADKLRKDRDTDVNSANALLTEIQTSVANKKALATVSASTRNYVQSAMGNLLMKKAEIDNGESSELLTKIDLWYDSLSALLTTTNEPTSVLGVDSLVTKAYNNRQLGTETSYNNYKAQYDAVKAAAGKIIGNFQDELDELVNNYNEPIIAKLNKLDETALIAYNYAVKEYSQYVMTITNKGYLNYTVQNDSTVKAFINNQNGLYALLDQYEAASDTLHNYLAKVDNIIPQSAIDYFQDLFDANTKQTWDSLVYMQQTIAKGAQAYYGDAADENSLCGSVTKAINDTVEALITASKNVLTEAIAKDAVNVMTGAITTYNTADSLYNAKLKAYTDSTTKYASNPEMLAKTIELGLEMNNIANLFDKALAQVANFNSDNFATTLWNSYLTNAKDSINGFIKGIKDPKDTTYCFAPDSLKSQVANDSLPKYLQEIDTIATKPTVANITDLKNTLDAIFNKAKEQEKKVADASKENFEAAALVAAYQDSLANLKKVYDYTDANILKMAGAGSELLKLAADSLTSYENAYELHKGELKDKDYQKTIDGIAEGFREEIVAAANKAVAAEQDLIQNTWKDKLVVAYNNANVYAEKDANTKAVLAAAAKYIAGIDTVLPAYKNINFDDPTAVNNDSLLKVLNDSVVKVFVDSAIVIEGQVGALYQQLCDLWDEGTDNNGETVTSPDPMADAMAIINEAKEAAQALIDEYNSTLAAAPESVQDQYTPVSEGFASDMATADATVKALGDRVILDPETYAADYNTIAANVAPALETLKEAKAAAEAEEARVAELTSDANIYNTELAGYEAEIEALKATVADYDKTLGDKTTIADVINPTLDELATQLAADKVGVELALQSAISNKADTVVYKFKGDYENVLAAEALSAAKQFATGANSNLLDAYTTIIPQINAINIAASVKDSVANKIKEIDAAKAYIADSIAKLNANSTGATVDAYTELADKALDVVEQLNALLEYAKASDFVLGDVDGTGGEPNVNDLLTIIDWVGEGLTLEDVAEKYGASTAAAADINGDGALNIADVTAEVNLITSAENGTPALASRKAHADAGTISLNAISTEEGVTRYAISIDSKFTFVGGLIDINLPEGAELVSTELISENHGAYRYDNEKGARLIIMSLENAVLTDQDNIVLYIDVEGATPEISVGQFTDKNSALYHLHVNNLTGIEDINAAEGTMGQRIYNVAGQTMRAIQRGINIIRNADGTTTKEYHK